MNNHLSEKLQRVGELLSEEERDFCSSYVANGNLMFAMEDAFPHMLKHEQVKKGAEYIQDKNIKAYIDTLDTIVNHQQAPSLDESLIGTARIARANIYDFLDSEGNIDVKKVSREKLYAVSELSTEYTGKKKVTKIKMYNKQQALKDLGTHYGGFRSSSKKENTSLEELLGAAEELVDKDSPSDPTKKSVESKAVIDAIDIPRIQSSNSSGISDKAKKLLDD